MRFFGISQAVFFLGLSLPAASQAGNDLPLTAADCRSELQRVLGRLRVNTPLQKNASLLELDPDALCQANRNAPLNRHTKANSIDEARICENTYIKTKKAVQDYKAAMEEACKKIDEVDSCPAGSNRTACMAQKAREAAMASQKASDALASAKAQIGEFEEAATFARDTFERDLPRIRAALAKNQRDIDAAKAAGNSVELERLTKLRAEATAVRNGELVTEGGLLAVFDENAVSSRRGIEGSRSTITSYAELIPRKGSNAGLFLEQDTAVRTMTVFNHTMTPEIARRGTVASSLNSFAAGLEVNARRQTESITKAPVTGTSSLSGLGQMQQAMALTSAGAGLTNAMNAQQAAGSVAPPAAPSMWENVAGTVQNITGLGGSNGPGSSKLGGDGATKSGGTQPGGPGGLADVPNADGPGVTGLGGAYGVASNGDTFVSGNGDLPELAGAASRTPAASSKPGDGIGADAKAYGKKRKGAHEEEASTCPPGQDCAALAATGAAFNKGGSLGVPVVGAADPGLNVKGALDGLFGELPTLDANGNPTTPVGMGDSGFGFGESEISVGTSLATGGRQGSPEVAPANSRTLFARVRGAHEKALKKGAVSLFHKKL